MGDTPQQRDRQLTLPLLPSQKMAAINAAIREKTYPTRHGTVSGAAVKAVLKELLKCEGKNATCWPAVKTIATAVSLHRATVLKALDLLEAQYFLSIKRRHGGRSNEYKIVWSNLNAVADDPSEAESLGAQAESLGAQAESLGATNSSLKESRKESEKKIPHEGVLFFSERWPKDIEKEFGNLWALEDPFVVDKLHRLAVRLGYIDASDGMRLLVFELAHFSHSADVPGAAFTASLKRIQNRNKSPEAAAEFEELVANRNIPNELWAEWAINEVEKKNRGPAPVGLLQQINLDPPANPNKPKEQQIAGLAAFKRQRGGPMP